MLLSVQVLCYPRNFVANKNFSDGPQPADVTVISNGWIVIEWTSDAAQLLDLKEALHNDHGDVLVK